jgi:hypothetical protein
MENSAQVKTERITSGRSLPWWGQCIALWLFLLIALTVVGAIAVRTLWAGDVASGYSPWPTLSPDTLPGLWLRWDANYYLSIALQGYAPNPDMHGFFPLYPLLVAVLSGITGWHVALSGMIIAQLSCLVAMLAFYQLARLIRDDHAYALWSVIFLMVFPAAFFFFVLYAESLYMALAILGLYAIMRARPWYIRSGLALALASLARPIGWLLNIVVAAEYVFRRKTDRALSWWRTLITLALSAGGTAAFVLYLYGLTGSFSAITQAQASWRRHWEWPWLTVWHSIEIALTGPRVARDWFLYAINWVDLLSTLFALTLIGIAVYRSFQRRFPWSITVYLLGTVVFTLLSEGPYYQGTNLVVVPLWGMTRWVAALFPLFLVMADVIRNRYARWAVALISGTLMFGFMVWWVGGRWVG